MPLGEVNFVSVLIAAVAAWIFGAIWYTVFSRAWLNALGMTAEIHKAQIVSRSSLAKAFPFVLSFVAELVMATMLYGIMTHSGLFGLRAGMISGALIWLGFVITTLSVNNAYPMRKPMLSVIDGGHWLGVLLIMGAIVGVLGK